MNKADPKLNGAFWQALIQRHGKQSGTRQMIDLLKLSARYGQLKLQEAIESALTRSTWPMLHRRSHSRTER